MLIFGIETSCDETACAIVENGVTQISAVMASSRELHESTGGVVPEVAARKQVEYMVPVINRTLVKAGLDTKSASQKIDAIAVTVGPGIIGSLLVGVEAARTLALLWNKPLIPVNHLVGHVYANFIDQKQLINFPAIVLIVSGGHTDLVLMRRHGDFEFLGGTLDDAAGEAFDKTARLLGLSKYLGGPELSKLAASCKNNKLSGRLPRPMIDQKNYDFSFSGLKTAVKRLYEQNTDLKDSIACEFENAVVDVLVHKTMKAAKKYNVKSVLLGGGVVANNQLRTRMESMTQRSGVDVFIPPIDLCTDTAVYIASAAFFNFDMWCEKKIAVNPSLGIVD